MPDPTMLATTTNVAVDKPKRRGRGSVIALRFPGLKSILFGTAVASSLASEGLASEGLASEGLASEGLASGDWRAGGVSPLISPL